MRSGIHQSITLGEIHFRIPRGIYSVGAGGSKHALGALFWLLIHAVPEDEVQMVYGVESGIPFHHLLTVTLLTSKKP